MDSREIWAGKMPLIFLRFPRNAVISASFNRATVVFTDTCYFHAVKMYKTDELLSTLFIELPNQQEYALSDHCTARSPAHYSHHCLLNRYAIVEHVIHISG